MYAGSGEFMPSQDVALAVAVFTRSACERFAHEAFRLAATRRRSVTIAHKANVLAMTTGMFRDVCMEVGRGYPDVAVRTEHVDALAALLIRTPEAFDVIVAENMFGDILSDLTGELCGSLGMAPSINASATKAMAQAAHGSAPDIAGRDVANPIAMILSAAMLLRWLSVRRDSVPLAQAATVIESAIGGVLDGGVGTFDIGAPPRRLSSPTPCSPRSTGMSAAGSDRLIGEHRQYRAQGLGVGDRDVVGVAEHQVAADDDRTPLRSAEQRR